MWWMLACEPEAADPVTFGSAPDVDVCPPGTICPWAGSGYAGAVVGASLDEVWFSAPSDVSPLADGRDALVADYGNARLVRVTAGGAAVAIPTPHVGRPREVAALAGGGWMVACDDSDPLFELTDDGDAIALPVAPPVWGVAATDDPDVVFVVSGDPPTLQRWTRSGEGWAAGAALTAFPTQYRGPLDPHDAGLAWLDGLLVFALAEDHVLWAADADTGESWVLSGVVGEAGDADGVDARWDHPSDVAADPESGVLYVADAYNHRIRAILPSGEVVTVAGTGAPTCGEEVTGPILVPQVCSEAATAGDGGPAVEATLYAPLGVAVGPDGAVWVADTFDQRVRVVR